MAHVPGNGPGQDGRGEIVEFGSRRRAGGRRGARVLLACVALAAVVTVAVRAADHPARHAAAIPAPPPSIRTTTVGHRLLGVTAGWELFARGPDELLRIEPAQGRIIETYVPSLETASPDVAFVIGPHDAVIRPFDLVPGYVVPDGGQARLLTGLLADGGPMVPGPAGSQAAWVTSGSPSSPALTLVTLTGRRSGPSIRFRPGGPQLPSTAVSDGRGDVLVTDGDLTAAYDTGPGWERPVSGTMLAVGPASWLVDRCDAQYRHCRNEVIDAATGSQRSLPGPATDPPFSSWPPTGVISPGGSIAAIAGNGRDGELTVFLIDLSTGATRDLNVPLAGPGSYLSSGGQASEQSMAWSPDGRWLFVAASGGKLVVINPRTGWAGSLGISLPAVDQVAIRP